MLFIVHAKVHCTKRGFYSDQESETSVTHAVEAMDADQARQTVVKFYEAKSGDGPYEDRYRVDAQHAFEFLNAADILAS